MKKIIGILLVAISLFAFQLPAMASESGFGVDSHYTLESNPSSSMVLAFSSGSTDCATCHSIGLVNHATPVKQLKISKMVHPLHAVALVSAEVILALERSHNSI